MKLLVACALLLVGTAEAKPHHKKKPAEADATDKDGAPKKKHHKGWPSPAAGPTESGDPELIFTFDDGPNPKTTPSVLDTLAKHHIHATFFLVGEMAQNPKAAPIIDRMLREGHIIANHTMTHQDLCRIKDDDRAAREIDEGKAAIEKAAPGYKTVWFRTPYGVRCERVDDLLGARGLQHFHWDLDPQEWKHNNTQKAIDYVEKEVGKMTGRNVLLMHDIKKATVEALPVILDWIETENAQRTQDHKRRIKIIQGYELAAAKMPPGLLDLIAEATPRPDQWHLGDALP
ncbi:MAG: polysaccharide deacetylase family protein [Kofleriaceae bacterium]